MKTFAAILTLTNAALCTGALAAGCWSLAFENVPFTACEVDPAEEEVRLFLKDADGRPFGSFDNVAAHVGTRDRDLVLAMNGGMYHPNRDPVGLYVEDGLELAPVVTGDGPGNFGLLPNGVLCLDESTADIVESLSFVRSGASCSFATQSGPLLVIDGQIHPRFLADSPSRFIRNGIGVTEDGRIVAAISDQPVNFHRFARLFRDVFETPDALFLDGKVSRLYAPMIGRHDFGLPMGPILGVVR
ncbi:MAG: phosphodiester glycosidase family protein [Boseongicola sp.]|nr:phosphodiester glycosidase family protein [Boseongicola sp.]